MIAQTASPRGGIDRSQDANLVARSIRRAQGGVVVLSGKRGSGKSDFIRDWVMPALGGDALYADCAAGIPSVIGPASLSLDQAIGSGKVLILDSVDRLLHSPARPDKETFERIFAARATLVFVTSDEHLSDLLTLSRFAPGILDNLVEVESPTLSVALTHYVPPEGGEPLCYDAEVLAKLEGDLERWSSDGASPLLVRIIDTAFRSLCRESVVSSVDVEDYGVRQGLGGILEDHLRDVWKGLGDVAGEAAAAVGTAVLEEVLATEGRSDVLSLSGVAERLAVDDGLPARCLTWLSGPDGVLRALGDGRYEMSPPQIRQLVRSRLEEDRLACRPAARLLAEGMRAKRALGSVLPEDRFREVDRWRHTLRTDADEAAFLTLCALRYAGGEQGPAGYWLRRIPDVERRVVTLMEAIYDSSAASRREAAALLRGVEQPEAVAGLYRLALEDEDESVRRTALTSLEHLKSEVVREWLVQEAWQESSRFRLRAISALRIFPDERSAAALRDLVTAEGSPVSVRRMAVDALAGCNSDAAVRALVDIALGDPDEEDRRAATDALGTLASDDLAERAVAYALQTPVAGPGPRRPFAVRLLAGVGAVVVGIVGLVIHGLPLLVCGRRLLGLSFLLIESVALGMVALASRDGPDWLLAGAFLAWFGNCVMASGAAAWQAISTRDFERDRPRPLASALAHVLPELNVLTVGQLVHGIGHMSLGRVRKGFELLGLEILGIGFLVVSLKYEALFAIGANASFERSIAETIQVTYLFVGGLLFVGTWAWDVGVVLRSHFLELRNGAARRRRDPVIESILAGPHGSAGVLRWLSSPDPRAVVRAKRLIGAFGSRLDVSSLAQYLLRADGSVPNVVVTCLAREKSDEIVRTLCAGWESRTEAKNAQIIRVLQKHPSESSLMCLAERRARLGPGVRVRNLLAQWEYRVRVWPPALVGIVLACAPLGLLLTYEAVQTTRQPERTQIKELRQLILRTAVLPGDATATRATATFLAQRYPGAASPELAAALQLSDSGHSEALCEALAIVLQSEAEDFADARQTALRALLAAATEQGAVKRSEAAWRELRDAMPRIKDSSLVPALAVPLGNPNLPHAGRLRAAGLLCSAGSDWSDVRAEARRGLSRQVPWFAEVLRSSESRELKAVALEAMTEVGDERAVTTLKEYVLNPPGVSLAESQARPRGAGAELWLAAIQSLRRVRTPDAVAALNEIAASRRASRAVRREARRQADDVDPWFRERALYEAGEYEKAIEAGSIKLADGRRPPKLTREGSLYVGKSYLQLLSRDSSYPDTYSRNAVQYLEAAQDDSEKTRDLLAMAHENRAAVHFNAGRWEEALASAAQAEKLGLQSAFLFNLRCIVYHEQVALANPKDGFRLAYEACGRVPGLSLTLQQVANANANLAEASISVGRYDEAIRLGKDCLSQMEGAEDRFSVLLLVYAAQVLKGDWAGAAGTLDEAEAEQEKVDLARATWEWRGTAAYVEQTQRAETPPVMALRSLLAAANTHGTKVPGQLFEENRVALRAARARRRPA
jgi:HEAT repeat protein